MAFPSFPPPPSSPPGPGRLRRYKFLHYAYTIKISRYAPENQTVKLFKSYKAKNMIQKVLFETPLNILKLG